MLQLWIFIFIAIDMSVQQTLKAHRLGVQAWIACNCPVFYVEVYLKKVVWRLLVTLWHFRIARKVLDFVGAHGFSDPTPPTWLTRGRPMFFFGSMHGISGTSTGLSKGFAPKHDSSHEMIIRCNSRWCDKCKYPTTYPALRASARYMLCSHNIAAGNSD